MAEANTTAAQQNTSHTTESRITIRITPVIEREYRRRDVFPELRLEIAARVINGATGVHLVTIERAREIMADAEAQNQNRGLPKGLPVAYNSIASHIRDGLRQEARRGLIDAPGIAEVQRRQAAKSASFSVGDRVLYFSAGSEYGREATIADGYRMYEVISNDGPYISRDDQRLEYRYGYCINLKESDHRFFVSAHRLTRDDCKPSHLRLVA